MKKYVLIFGLCLALLWPGMSFERRGKKRPTRVQVAVSGCQTGIASWYAPGRGCLGCRGGGRRTANGERFTGQDMTAAHRTLPFGTMVRVRVISMGREATVRINDRGPFVPGRIIDLSKTAARALGIQGTARVEICW